MTARRATARFAAQEGDPRIWTVSEIVRSLKVTLETDYAHVVVQGEITDIKRSPGGPGHIYFCLKDANAQISVAYFSAASKAGSNLLANGLAVQAEGRVSVYPQRGSMQLIADRVSPIGYGALQAKFEQLKRKLQAEGLFAEERKRRLPPYPTRIGLVTSESGAAIRDMIRILRHRAPYAEITLAATRVQGDGAAAAIAEAIGLMNEWGRPEVLIVGRGGGSIEDLWAFNEEAVVRAIVMSRIPVISAVGHEVDVTLADLAADLRAATPTHAASQVVLDRDEIRRTLAGLSKHARDRLRRELERERARLNGVRKHRALREPHRLVEDAMQRVDQTREQLTRALEGVAVARSRQLEVTAGRVWAHTPDKTIQRARDRVQAFVHRAERGAASTVARMRSDVESRRRLLESFDYKGVLRRGYALVWTERADKKDRLVNRVRDLRSGAPIQVEFADGAARAQVTETAPAQPVQKEETE